MIHLLAQTDGNCVHFWTNVNIDHLDSESLPHGRKSFQFPVAYRRVQKVWYQLSVKPRLNWDSCVHKTSPTTCERKRFPSCAAIQFGQFYISSQWDPSSTDTIADTGLAPPCLYYDAIWASLEYFLPWNCWWPLPDSQHLNIVVKSKCEMRRIWKRYVLMSEQL